MPHGGLWAHQRGRTQLRGPAGGACRRRLWAGRFHHRIYPLHGVAAYVQPRPLARGVPTVVDVWHAGRGGARGEPAQRRRLARARGRVGSAVCGAADAVPAAAGLAQAAHGAGRGCASARAASGATCDMACPATYPSTARAHALVAHAVVANAVVVHAVVANAVVAHTG
eukprot:356602-Chlamydomonas_euryale.AAC.14